ncbi:hypothetical protein V2J93_25020, partial [Pseudomonas alliivorans]|nr:hypothetical protein [Pseudomonas alliivorans]
SEVHRLGVEVHFFDFGVGSHHGAGSRKKTGTQHQASAIALECGVCGADTDEAIVLTVQELNWMLDGFDLWRNRPHQVLTPRFVA